MNILSTPVHLAAGHFMSPAREPGNGEEIKPTVFDQVSFYQAAFADVESAQHQVLIQSPYATIRGTERWCKLLQQTQQRGVQTCVFLQEPMHWTDAKDDSARSKARARMNQLQTVIDVLLEFGVHVNLRPRIHEKLIVIDNQILWDGSLNVLSHYDTSERMTRWDNKNQATDAVVRHRMDCCATCPKRQFYPALAKEQVRERLVQIGEELAYRRELMNLSQKAVGHRMGSCQSTISNIEGAKITANADTLIEIGAALGLELVFVPRQLVAAVTQVLNTRLRQTDV